MATGRDQAAALATAPFTGKGPAFPGHTLAAMTIHEHNNYSTNDEKKTVVIMILFTRKGTYDSNNCV